MTREEFDKYAIENGLVVWSNEMSERAIKALEQEPKTGFLDKIRAEIDSYCSDNRDRNDGLYIAMRIIDKYRQEV